MTTTQSPTRRNLFRVGAAAAVAVSVPAAAMASAGHGSDIELLAMIAKSEALWVRHEDVNYRHIELTKSLLSPECHSHSDEEWIEAMKDPRAEALGREVKALGDAAMALEEPIRSHIPCTLEGAVAQAEFISGDVDFKEILLANLRRIMEARS
jgi:hypothetical protein